MSTSETALVRANPQRAGTAQSVRSVRSVAPAQVLLCNRCVKPLATTCYLCMCDCIFCEECTFAHFANCSECPKCGKTLGEDDFTELVVADANGAQTDIAKTSMQALFSNNSGTGNLPFNDLCRSLLRQIDVVRQSTKFLLKQQIVNSNLQGQNRMAMARVNEQYKAEVTRLKQQQSTQRLQNEQTLTEMSNRLRAREAAYVELQKDNKEKDRIIEQFRRLHNGMVPSSSGGGDGSTSGRSGGLHHVPPSSSQGSRLGAERMVSSRMGGGGGQQQQQEVGPLNGFMRNQANTKSAQQQAINARRAPLSALGTNGPTFRRSNSLGNHVGSHPYARPQQQQHQSPHRGPSSLGRPFSSTSTGSGNVPATPRIRELSSRQGFAFSGGGHGGGPQRQNRRRGATPSSAGGGSMLASMSPRTSNLMTQGPHSTGWGTRR